MKITLLLLFVFLSTESSLQAQDKNQAEKLVSEGVALEDNGNSDQALIKYQQALDVDKDNAAALGEMAYSLLSLQKYEDAIKYCKTAIKTHPGDQALKSVYITYGTAYDNMNDTKKSIDIYNEGIRIFPDYYSLYYNKGITLTRESKLQESLDCFEKSVSLKPDHPSSNYAIATVCMELHKTIPAIMAYCRLITLEPKSDRTKLALANIETLMSNKVEKTGDKNVTITVSPDMLDVGNKKQIANNFSGVEFNLTLASALDYDSTTRDLSPVQKFKRKIDVVCESLKGTRGNNSGFYWDFYAPYLIEMKEKDLTTTFSYIAFTPTGTPEVNEWLTQNKSETEAFLKWSSGFNWK